jgi:hypothetical protein
LLIPEILQHPFMCWNLKAFKRDHYFFSEKKKGDYFLSIIEENVHIFLRKQNAFIRSNICNYHDSDVAEEQFGSLMTAWIILEETNTQPCHHQPIHQIATEHCVFPCFSDLCALLNTLFIAFNQSRRINILKNSWRIDLWTLSSCNSNFHMHIKYFIASFYTVIVNNRKSIIWIAEHTPHCLEYGT